MLNLSGPTSYTQYSLFIRVLGETLRVPCTDFTICVYLILATSTANLNHAVGILMTRLASITNNHLALRYEACGNNSMVAVQFLMCRLCREITVHELIPKLRCSNCKVKGRVSFAITHVGHSSEAMLRNRQGG